METITSFMAKDHDKLDALFKEFRNVKNNNKNKARNFFHEFKINLQKHIVWEEEILFPIFEQKTGMYNIGPTDVMRMEHRQIKEFLEKTHDKIIIGTIQEIDELENSLLEVLKLHNKKEENILYPSIDDFVGEKEKNSIFTKMKNLPVERYNKCCE